jgi:hypothetical protein
LALLRRVLMRFCRRARLHGRMLQGDRARLGLRTWCGGMHDARSRSRRMSRRLFS